MISGHRSLSSVFKLMKTAFILNIIYTGRKSITHPQSLRNSLCTLMRSLLLIRGCGGGTWYSANFCRGLKAMQLTCYMEAALSSYLIFASELLCFAFQFLFIV